MIFKNFKTIYTYGKRRKFGLKRVGKIHRIVLKTGLYFKCLRNRKAFVGINVADSSPIISQLLTLSMVYIFEPEYFIWV